MRVVFVLRHGRGVLTLVNAIVKNGSPLKAKRSSRMRPSNKKKKGKGKGKGC